MQGYMYEIDEHTEKGSYICKLLKIRILYIDMYRLVGQKSRDFGVSLHVASKPTSHQSEFSGDSTGR